MINLSKVKSVPEWHTIRRKVEAAVETVLGSLPKERVDLQAKFSDDIPLAGCVRRRVNYFVTDWERISAWVFLPHGEQEDIPAILCCHQRVPQGKDEPAGIEGDPRLAFAQHYAEMGYATIAPDCVTAGERVSVGLRPFDPTLFHKDHPAMSAIGKMLWDHIHALDVLCEVKGVDGARLGVMGHDLGALNALFLAAFDERVQACVASCGGAQSPGASKPEDGAKDAEFQFSPTLSDVVKKRKTALDWEHVLALCAPSPTLLVTARGGAVAHNKTSWGKAHVRAGKVYELLGAPNALDHRACRQTQDVTAEVLEAADDWFERWL